MMDIIRHTQPIQKILPHLISHIHSKNTLVRLRITQYFEVILNAALTNLKSAGITQGTRYTANVEMIDGNSDIIDLLLIKGTED